MTPAHVISTLREFGRSAGLADFSLNVRGSAAVRFDSGATLRFEYSFEALTLAMTVPCAGDSSTLMRILSYACPSPRGGVAPLRCGYLDKTGCAVFALRIPEPAVTLPALSNAFSRLWSITTEFGGPQ